MHGVLVVDKPSGPTSHDIVAAARKRFGTRSVGHAGTLDPMATGVLLVLFGEACKLSSYLTAQEKAYRTRVVLGRGTDTLDAEGAITSEVDVPGAALAPELVAAALNQERERREQLPPAFSAIKVDGQRAHRRARQGEVVQLAPRPVHVSALELMGLEGAEIELSLRVSKGYYVRALARDIGQHLGFPAHLSSLRRTASGPFSLDDAIAWPAPEAAAPIPTTVAAQRALPSARLNEAGVLKARQGKRIELTDFIASPPAHPPAPSPTTPPVVWLDERGSIIALGRAAEDGFRVLRGFQPH